MNTSVPTAPSLADLEHFIGLLRARDPRTVDPATGALRPEAFRPIWFPWLTVIERDGGRYRYRLMGEGAIRFCGENLRGRSTTDLPPNRTEYLHQAYGQILGLGAAQLASCEYLFSNGAGVAAKTALVPLKGSRKQSDRIVLLSAPDLRAATWLGQTDVDAPPRPVDIRHLDRTFL